MVFASYIGLVCGPDDLLGRCEMTGKASDSDTDHLRERGNIVNMVSEKNR